MTQKEDLENLRKDVEGLEVRVLDLERFRAWVFGLGGGIGAIIAFFADALRKKLGLG